MLLRKLVPVFALSLASAGVSADRLKPEDAVEYRQSAFRLMSFQLGVLNPLHRRQAYDDEAFIYRAETLSRLAELALEGFTEDSKGQQSRTQARMWDEREAFETRLREFAETTAQMAERSAAGDSRATRDLFRQTLQSCKSCHDRYRIE